VTATLIALAVLVAGGLLVRWMVVEGRRHGDEPLDATSRVVLGSDGAEVTVTNPGSEPVVVGMSASRYRALRFEQLRVPFVSRAPRWYERRRPDRGASTVLGVVPAGDLARWNVATGPGPVRLTLTLGQADDRLRIHEHLVAARHRADAVAARRSR
jgi:hypothetical protein